jgi:hypothetical protein
MDEAPERLFHGVLVRTTETLDMDPSEYAIDTATLAHLKWDVRVDRDT